MNVAHNFLAVKDAPLSAVPLDVLISMLTKATSTHLVTSKQSTSRKYSTTVYDPVSHQLCRALHDHGTRSTLKSIARKNICVKLLENTEVVELKVSEYGYVECRIRRAS